MNILALSPEVTTLIVGLFAGVCSVAAAYTANRTRKENSQQHGQSQQLLANVADKVEDVAERVDEHGRKLDAIASRVDHAHHRLDSHKPRRWFR